MWKQCTKQFTGSCLLLFACDRHEYTETVAKMDAASPALGVAGLDSSTRDVASSKPDGGVRDIEGGSIGVDASGNASYAASDASTAMVLNDNELACGLTAGPFVRIYDPSPSPNLPWYINDHTIVRGPDSQWHLIGITHEEPLAPDEEREFAHATSPTLATPTWTRRAPSMVVDEASGERVLWAPYVLLVDGLYHMFYCAGGEHEAFQIKHATSKDLWGWTRDQQPLFTDGVDARDPFVLRIGAQWVIYYTANSEPTGGNHVVAYRTSDDLVHWSSRSIAYRDPTSGTIGGNTESPYVLARPEGYYLFIGPRGSSSDIVGPSDKHYDATAVFFSHNPFHFESVPMGLFPAHAAEIVEDLDGSLWITRSGWERGGVFIAPLTAQCRS